MTEKRQMAAAYAVKYQAKSQGLFYAFINATVTVVRKKPALHLPL